MNVKELRIGNWLCGDDDAPNDTKYQLDVSSIADQTIKDKYFGYPIPLTEKWLQDFGFKPFGEDGLLSIEAFSPGHPSQRFDIDWSQEKGVMCKSRYQADADWFFMHHIQYVHQLQNLYFALTGEELTINNQPDE